MSTPFSFSPKAIAFGVGAAFHYAAIEPRPAAPANHVEAQVDQVTLVATPTETSTATAKLKTFSIADMLEVLGISRLSFMDGIASGRYPECDLIAGKRGSHYWFEETVNEILATIEASAHDDAITKPCRVCKLVKTLSEFIPQRQCIDGYTTICRACTREARDDRRALRGGGPVTKRVDKPYEGIPAASRWEVTFSLRRDRPDGKLKAYTEIDRRGIVPRGEISSVIANYLKTTT
jgi:hypothetical protein